MKLYFSNNLRLSSTLNEQEDLSLTNTSRITGYQKPKQRWMAKDQSMNVVNGSVELNNEDSGLCSGSSASNEARVPSENVYTSHQVSDLTPLRGNYIGISPSNSSSAPGTFALPSSLTTTSSSPSNHPSPQNRFGQNIPPGSHCESPSTSYQTHESVHSFNSKESSQSKTRRRRGRPPKTKIYGNGYEVSSKKRQWQQTPIPLDVNPVPPHPSTSTSSLFTGGLKIRLRRDLSVEEPVCGKRGRSRKSNKKSVQVFRIVESWCDADAPGGLAAKTTSASPISTNQIPGGFRIGDVVWAKIAGYPHWPSRISALYARTPHQLAQVNPECAKNTDSLAVSATPSDPSLAAGFTAKVEWFAWDQCSYLSCAKLFPFTEYFSKLYSPRTRVKNYAEAINMAKQVVEANSLPPPPIPEPRSDVPLSLSLPTSTDVPCPTDLQITFNSLTEPKQPTLPELPLDLHLQDPTIPPAGNDPVGLPDGGNFPFLSIAGNPGEFGQVPEPCWDPLPQLDISGLNDFTSGVPTFSDDEGESSEALANQLKTELGSIKI
ncbi:unnamed protein product [Hymenolepis diminuta]|uniref:PWWP domain-containing protein n=2 Tax=Hymenolepis diminuta TaxID=6216 RepID=A0A0R3S8T3_HYMDI|nr:unnamed protein product [Hymenolepis diminuta]